jgi:2-aminoadipate transaminase
VGTGLKVPGTMSRIPLAKRMENMSGNVIREILKLTQQSQVISFAGGLPSPETFPAEKLADITERIIKDNSKNNVLQYGTTEGYMPLREYIAQWVIERGVKANTEEVIILSGSQQGIDLACTAFLNPGDCMLVERPTYLSVLQILKMHQITPVHLSSDEYGVDPQALKEAIAKYNPRVLYLVPTFRNPSGESIALHRRQEIVEIAKKNNLLIIEDDPYGLLRYSGQAIPVMKGLDDEGNVLYLGSFSKIVSPGLRVGYAVGRPEILRPMVIVKQGADVHTSNLTQCIVSTFCREGNLPSHIESICKLYKVKRDYMLSMLDKYFPKKAVWTHPEGGLFIWVSLPGDIDTNKLLPKAVDKGVAFIPGTPFFADGGGNNCMRLNFSCASKEEIEKGIKSLAEVIAEAL